MLAKFTKLLQKIDTAAVRKDTSSSRAWLTCRRWSQGFKVRSFGQGNKVNVVNALTGRVDITFMGSNNLIEIQDGAVVKGLRINVCGHDNYIRIGRDAEIDGLFLWITESRSKATVGDGTFFQNGSIYLTESESCVSVGRDCMIAGGSVLRCGDGHAIYDQNNGIILNRANHICIEDHVWLTTDVLVLKDVTVGQDSVVASRAVVTKNIPRNSLAAGIPAKIIRSEINWRRENIDRLPRDWFMAPPKVEKQS